MINGIYLLLGTNLGDRLQHLEQAISLIESEVGKVISQSAVYETDAWGKEDMEAFLNQVLEVSSDLSPQQLLKEILDIEQTLGRIRSEKWGARVIDIDILYYQHQVIKEPDLQIPHPHLQERRFTLVPLCEIAPLFVHPVLSKTQQELLLECQDPLTVKPLF